MGSGKRYTPSKAIRRQFEDSPALPMMSSDSLWGPYEFTYCDIIFALVKSVRIRVRQVNQIVAA
jgi:hypothetical protein